MLLFRALSLTEGSTFARPPREHLNARTL